MATYKQLSDLCKKLNIDDKIYDKIIILLEIDDISPKKIRTKIEQIIGDKQKSDKILNLVDDVISEAKSTNAVELPNSNLLIYGFDHDTNGNYIVKVGYPNSRGFSIQTGGVLKNSEKSGKEVRGVANKLSSDQLKAISKEVTTYIEKHGSDEQKKKLKIYEATSMTEVTLEDSLPEFEVFVDIDSDGIDAKSTQKLAEKLGIEGSWRTGYIIKTKVMLKDFVNKLKGFDVSIKSITDSNDNQIDAKNIPVPKQTGRPTNKYNYANRMMESKQEKEQGGIPDAIWQQTPIENYNEGHGWIYNDSRTDEADKILVDLLNKHGLFNEEIAAFLVSSYGRFYGDALSHGIEQAKKVLPKLAAKLKADIKQYGITIFEAADEGKMYWYCIDLDERGQFQAHVQGRNNDDIFSIDDIDDLQNIIDDGFMKNKDDVDGLQNHLIDMGILKTGDILTDDEPDWYEELNESKVPILESFSSFVKKNIITESDQMESPIKKRYATKDVNGDEISVGDKVKIVGDVEDKGKKGTVEDNPNGFVVVKLKNGNYSFNSSNVKIISEAKKIDEADSDGKMFVVYAHAGRFDGLAYVCAKNKADAKKIAQNCGWLDTGTVDKVQTLAEYQKENDWDDSEVPALALGEYEEIDWGT